MVGCVSTRMFQGIACVAACAAAFMVTGPAKAQFGEAAGIAEAMQPDYYQRDVVIVSQSLNLDETQRVIVKTLFEDYQASFEEGLERMKKRFDNMREDLQSADTKSIMKAVFAPFRDWNVEKAQLGAQFMANVEVVLTAEQRDLLPGLQRRLYRERNLHKGRLSGESVNLMDVVRDMNFDARLMIQLQPVLDAYEIALDRALHNREDPITGKSNPMLESLEEQDPEKGRIALKQHIDRQIAVRNVNDEYIEQIALALPSEKADAFRAAALDRAYPRVYRETPVQRLFKAARELQGLDSATLQSVTALEAEFLSELSSTNQKLLASIRANEPQEAQERAADFAKRMAGQQVETKPNPTIEVFSKREGVMRSYVKRLHGILTEDQFALLPGGYRWIDTPNANAEPASMTKDRVGREQKTRNRTELDGGGR
jgi:hypothetical protein